MDQIMNSFLKLGIIGYSTTETQNKTFHFEWDCLPGVSTITTIFTIIDIREGINRLVECCEWWNGKGENISLYLLSFLWHNQNSWGKSFRNVLKCHIHYTNIPCVAKLGSIYNICWPIITPRPLLLMRKNWNFFLMTNRKGPCQILD